MSRGGFVVHRLVGCACEADAFIQLSRLVPTLEQKEARWLIAELEKIDSATVAWDEVRRNEYRFHHEQPREGAEFAKYVMRQLESRPALQVAKRRHKQIAARLRLLAAALAVRCFQSEQSRQPNGLKQLIPEYLRCAPLDPFSGKPVIYRLEGSNWLLYSVGEDGVDNGGEPVAGSVPGTVTKATPFSIRPIERGIRLGHFGVLAECVGGQNGRLTRLVQSTTNPGLSAPWTTNSLVPVVVNGQNTVTMPSQAHTSSFG
jgi:hypothetical protein